MKEHGILFKPEMIRAIEDGRKTMTRRIVKAPKLHEDYGSPIWDGALIDGEKGKNEYLHLPFVGLHGDMTYHRVYPKYQPGDRLYCKEAIMPVYRGRDMVIAYKNTLWENRDAKITPEWFDKHYCKWISPLFMPKAAARLWLEVESVKVERVQEISAEDAKAEGVCPWLGGWDVKQEIWWQGYDGRDKDKDNNLIHTQHKGKNQPEWMIEPKKMIVNPSVVNVLAVFEALWISINGQESWDNNDWVFVYKFRRINHV
jgi:hypothetical protein